MRPTGTQRRKDQITTQAKNRDNRLKLEDQNLVQRYDTNIEEAKRGNLKSGFTQTSLTGMKQNWSEIPQKQGLSALDTQIRNLIFASNNAQSDQEAGAYMAAAWELQNKWDVQEDQDTTYTRAASQDMTAIDQNQEDKKNMSPSEFFGTNQYGEGGSADPTNVAKTTSNKDEQSKTLKSKGYDDSFIEDDLDLADRKIEGRTVIPDNPNRQGYVGGKKISNIQKDLLRAGHTKENLSALMEANKDRPKVTDLLKIFKK
mgnify:CR=1 FL=1